MDKMKAYKIRDKETGLFSRGGSSTYNIWSKVGKTWSNLGHIKNHLNHSFLLHDGTLSKEYPYHNAEIIIVEVDYSNCFRYDMSILVDDMRESKAEQDKRNREYYEKWIREQELKRLAELQSKYPDFKSE